MQKSNSMLRTCTTECTSRWNGKVTAVETSRVTLFDLDVRSTHTNTHSAITRCIRQQEKFRKPQLNPKLMLNMLKHLFDEVAYWISWFIASESNIMAVISLCLCIFRSVYSDARIYTGEHRCSFARIRCGDAHSLCILANRTLNRHSAAEIQNLQLNASYPLSLKVVYYMHYQTICHLKINVIAVRASMLILWYFHVVCVLPTLTLVSRGCSPCIGIDPSDRVNFSDIFFPWRMERINATLINRYTLYKRAVELNYIRSNA